MHGQGAPCNAQIEEESLQHVDKGTDHLGGI